MAAPPRRVLLTYAWCKTLGWATNRKTEIFIDSGAFTAFSSGQPIRVLEYAEYLKRWGNRSEVYANLDVIGSIDQTVRNQRILEDQGLHPLPVFHWGEDYSVLERLCDEYKYVACSGAVSVFGQKAHRNERARHFAKVFEITNKYKTLVHGFGVTDFGMLESLPWYSVDSSSWARGRKYGSFVMFDPRTHKVFNVNVNDPADAYKYRDVLAQCYGVSYTKVLQRRYTWQEYDALSTRAWEKMEDWLTEINPHEDRDDQAKRPHRRGLQPAQHQPDDAPPTDAVTD